MIVISLSYKAFISPNIRAKVCAASLGNTLRIRAVKAAGDKFLEPHCQLMHSFIHSFAHLITQSFN